MLFSRMRHNNNSLGHSAVISCDGYVIHSVCVDRSIILQTVKPSRSTMVAAGSRLAWSADPDIGVILLQIGSKVDRPAQAAENTEEAAPTGGDGWE